MYLLGYDIGSSSLKTALVSADTKEVIDVVQYPDHEMEMISVQKGWAEQEPELWWNYLCLGTKRILKNNNIDASQIISIGISYQMHGLVLVDKDFDVLRPAIIWCDSRAVTIGDEAFQKLGETFCLENYMNSPGNFTASKLKWVKDNEPHIYKKIYKAMLPGDYIAMKLSGKITTTISGLSEGVLWNFKENKIATRLLDYYEISHKLIPDIVPTFSESGQVTEEASKVTGLATGTLISYRAGDQPNNALCLNVLRPGEIAATSGTSGVVYGVVDKRINDHESRVNAFAHVNYEKNKTRIGILLCINGAGIQYNWLRNHVAHSNENYDDMERTLSTVPIGSEGVMIYPFGNGAERIFSNRNIGSHIHNVEFNRHTRAHLYRAALEGVAFTFVYGIKFLKDMGLEIKSMRVGNDNMFRSEVFSTTISTLLGIDLEVFDTTGAVGAALASGHGCGIFRTIESAMKEVKPLKTFRPTSNATAYKEAYASWIAELSKLLINEKYSDYKKDIKCELKEKNTIIANQVLMLQDQDRRLQEIESLLIHMNDENTSTDLKNVIDKLRINKIETKNFSEHVDFMANPFINKLKQLFPDLSFEDLKLCYYIKLKFATNEIANKLNLSYRGTETKRYRLRQKLNLKKGTNLSSYLDTL